MAQIKLNGGLGDLFVIDSFMTQDERNDLDAIYLHSRANYAACDLFASSPSYAHVRIVKVDDQTPIPEGVEDWSIIETFGMFAKREHRRSTFLTDTPAPLDGLELPTSYVVVQHETPDNTRDERRVRDLKENEWNALVERLVHEDRVAVVLNTADASSPPEHPRIHNLVGKTTIQQSVAILRQAEGYWGIASCLAVLACQLFPPDRLWIKGPEVWLKMNAHLYCAPHKTFPFLFDRLTDFESWNIDNHMKLMLMKQLRVVNNQLVAAGSIVPMNDEQAREFMVAGLAEPWTPPEPAKVEPLKTASAKPPKRRATKLGGTK